MPGSFTGGLGSQLGLAAETTYGTPVTVNRFYEYTSEALNLSRNFLMSQGLRGGRMYQSSTRRVATTRSAAGTIQLETPSQGQGQILNLLHGETITPVKIGAGVAYKQVHKIGTTDPFGKSVTLQIGRPNVGGTVDPYTLPGVTATSVAISCQTGGYAEQTLTVDARDEETGVALATAAYPVGLEGFDFTDCVLKVNSVEQKLARGISLTFNAPKDTSRFYLGAEKKAAPLTNAYNAGTAAVTVDYGDTTLYKLFSEAKIVPLEATLLSPGTISEANKPEIKFVCAAVGLDGDSPNVAGPGPLQQQINFIILDNGTNPPVEATVVSAESTL